MHLELNTLQATVKTQQQIICNLKTDLAKLKSSGIASPASDNTNEVGNTIQPVEVTAVARLITPLEEETGTTTSTPPATTHTEEDAMRNAILDQHSQNLQSSSSSSESDSDTDSDTDSHPTSHMSRQRHFQRRERINPSSAQPTIDLFIGLLNNKNKRRHIQSHILTKAHVKVDKDKIVALNKSRNGKKFFKISVPQDKAKRILSIWNSPIRAEVYRGGPRYTLIEPSNRFRRFRRWSNSYTEYPPNKKCSKRNYHSDRSKSSSRYRNTNNRFRNRSSSPIRITSSMNRK